jgi:hypothetical protein
VNFTNCHIEIMPYYHISCTLFCIFCISNLHILHSIEIAKGICEFCILTYWHLPYGHIMISYMHFAYSARVLLL